MSNIFLSPANRQNLETSIRGQVDIEIFKKYLNQDDINGILLNSNNNIHCWAMTESRKNLYNMMNIGDWVIFSEKNSRKFTDFGEVNFKIHNIGLGKGIWPFTTNNPWEYIYFLKNIQRIDVNKEDFIKKLGYDPNFNLPGQILVDNSRIISFNIKFGSLSSYLGLRELDKIDYLEDILINEIMLATPLDCNEEPKLRLEPINYNGRITYPRDPRIAKKALINSGYCCEVDKNHLTFIAKASNENYVEAHHLIPMKFQIEYDYSIDNPANIITLCPHCHRLIHHSKPKEKEPILKVIFEQRQFELEKYGIRVCFNKLLEYYDI